MTTLYDELIAAGVKTDHYESTLYFPADERTREILTRHPVDKKNATIFIANNTEPGERVWFDVPFAYSPFWRNRGMTA